MAHVLVIDDEPSICWSLRQVFEAEGYRVATASSAEAGLELATQDPPDVIFLDVRLPGISGLQAISQFKQRLAGVPIVLMTAFGDLAIAVEAYQSQVAEYLTKPFDLDRATEAVRHAMSLSEAVRVTSPVSESIREGELVGRSAAMQEVFKRIALASQGDVPVLLTGESGTGKELAAAAIHQHSARRLQPYIPVTLPALSESLIESELFGHARGAFTGANERHEGLFSVASGGTILLDEIGDLSLTQQVKLLRVLEQGAFTPVGDTTPQRCDVRVLAATHQDLQSKIADQAFREDLFFRLAVFPIHLPALRDRLDDLPLLCDSILRRLRYQDGVQAIEEEAMGDLLARKWRGNVRELRNTLEHAALMARGHRIGIHHLPAEQAVAPTSSRNATLTELVEQWVGEQLGKLSAESLQSQGLFDRFMAEVEPALLGQVLAATSGNKVAAATSLGIHRATLREKLRR